MLKFLEQKPDAKVSPAYGDGAFDPGSVSINRFPSGWMKVFHPTQKGHAKIADAIKFDIDHEQALQGQGSSGGWAALPDDKNPSDSGKRVNDNFPRTFRLTDGHQSVKEIFYRMRDQVCQRICGKVKGDSIPSDLLASQKLNSDGCEIATKLSAGKELYFQASHSGDNCYKATAKIIEQKFSDGADRFFDTAAAERTQRL